MNLLIFGWVLALYSAFLLRSRSISAQTTTGTIKYITVVGEKVTLLCNHLVENTGTTLLWATDKKEALTVGSSVIHSSMSSRVRLETMGTSYNLLIDPVESRDAGFYTCTASDTINSKIRENEAQLIVKSAPNITEYSTPNPIIGEGRTLELKCAASGNPQPSIEWQEFDIFTNAFGPVVSGSTFLLTNITRNHSLRYRCIARNEIGVSVKEFKPQVMYRPIIDTWTKGVSQFPGGDSALKCEYNSTDPAEDNCWWEQNGQVITDHWSSKFTSRMWTPFEENGVSRRYMVLEIRLLNEEDFSATYTCFVKNPLGTHSRSMRIGRFDTPHSQQPPAVVDSTAARSSSERDSDRERRLPGGGGEGAGSGGKQRGNGVGESGAGGDFVEYQSEGQRESRTRTGDGALPGDRAGDKTSDRTTGKGSAQPLQADKTGIKDNGTRGQQSEQWIMLCMLALERLLSFVHCT